MARMWMAVPLGFFLATFGAAFGGCPFTFNHAAETSPLNGLRDSLLEFKLLCEPGTESPLEHQIDEMLSTVSELGKSMGEDSADNWLASLVTLQDDINKVFPLVASQCMKTDQVNTHAVQQNLLRTMGALAVLYESSEPDEQTPGVGAAMAATVLNSAMDNIVSKHPEIAEGVNQDSLGPEILCFLDSVQKTALGCESPSADKAPRNLAFFSPGESRGSTEGQKGEATLQLIAAVREYQEAQKTSPGHSNTQRAKLWRLVSADAPTQSPTTAFAKWDSEMSLGRSVGNALEKLAQTDAAPVFAALLASYGPAIAARMEEYSKQLARAVKTGPVKPDSRQEVFLSIGQPLLALCARLPAFVALDRSGSNIDPHGIRQMDSFCRPFRCSDGSGIQATETELSAFRNRQCQQISHYSNLQNQMEKAFLKAGAFCSAEKTYFNRILDWTGP